MSRPVSPPLQGPVVIYSAGIAGVSTSCFLATRHGLQDILLVDENSPLSLTSAHSTECCRNWRPDPEMMQLINLSIDLLEELAQASGNVFHNWRAGANQASYREADQ